MLPRGGDGGEIGAGEIERVEVGGFALADFRGGGLLGNFLLRLRRLDGWTKRTENCASQDERFHVSLLAEVDRRRDSKYDS